MSSYSLESCFLYEVFFQETHSLEHLHRMPREAAWSQLKLDWCKIVNEHSLRSYTAVLYLGVLFSLFQETCQQNIAAKILSEN